MRVVHSQFAFIRSLVDCSARARAVVGAARRASRCAWTSEGTRRAPTRASSRRALRLGARAACRRAPPRRPKTGAAGTRGLAVRWWYRPACVVTRTSDKAAARRADARVATPPPTRTRPDRACGLELKLREGRPFCQTGVSACNAASRLLPGLTKGPRFLALSLTCLYREAEH